MLADAEAGAGSATAAIAAVAASNLTSLPLTIRRATPARMSTNRIAGQPALHAVGSRPPRAAFPRKQEPFRVIPPVLDVIEVTILLSAMS